MRGNARTRGAYGIITNKSLKSGGSYDYYSNDFNNIEFFENFQNKLK